MAAGLSNLLGKRGQAGAVGFRRHFATLPIHVAPSFSARLQTAVSLGPKEGATTHHEYEEPLEQEGPQGPLLRGMPPSVMARIGEELEEGELEEVN